MKDQSQLIVMLTHNDCTVADAYSLFERCQQSPVHFWGIKEYGLPLEEMKRLFELMHRCQKTTILEVVAYTEKEGLEGAKIAAYCGCDILMGTCYFDSIHQLCNEYGIKYMPFVGTIKGRPSVLTGTIDDIINEAQYYTTKGVYGFDLLAYRYDGNISSLINNFCAQIKLPICIAGSINNYQRLDIIKQLQPWGFTIGSALFENKFGTDFSKQIQTIYDYMQKDK